MHVKSLLTGLPGIPRAVLSVWESGKGREGLPASIPVRKAVGREWGGGLATGLDSKGCTGDPVQSQWVFVLVIRGCHNRECHCAAVSQCPLSPILAPTSSLTWSLPPAVLSSLPSPSLGETQELGLTKTLLFSQAWMLLSSPAHTFSLAKHLNTS